MSASGRWLHAPDFKKKAFTSWLLEHGTEVNKGKGEYELLRYMRHGFTYIIWDKPSKRRVTFDEGSWRHWQRFLKGEEPDNHIEKMEAVEQQKPKPKSSEKPKARNLKRGDPDRRLILLYTDAGHHTQTRSGSWAGVVPHAGVVSETHGVLNGDVSSANGAEARAVANALWAFSKAEIIRSGDEVHVRLDNQHVVDALLRGPGNQKDTIKPQTLEAVEYVFEVGKKLDLLLKFAWVKGHVNKDKANAHEDMNRRADLLCRRVARAEYNRRKKK